MNRFRKEFTLFSVLYLFPILIFGQDIWSYRGLKEIRKQTSVSYYLDTLTLDTLICDNETGERILKSKENIEISRGFISADRSKSCSCEASPNGFWKMRYRNGNLKETGEFTCNEKVGTWTYYYENGNIQRIETYTHPYPEFLTQHSQDWDTLENRNYMLSGLFTEFHPNGSLKKEGSYAIVEVYAQTDTLTTFDPETYETVTKTVSGSFWLPQSIKVGIWRELDDRGKLVKFEYFPSVEGLDKAYRPIESRYYDLFFRDKK
ncbi:MAG: hypothetical protein WCR52_22925 [Bacteroidota bacterium]|uniref:toxin-antitoxin system YwqK family antitoxin n=1 Tax=Runella sp. TaxID=1960881 RepID=UPI0030163EE7